MTPTIRDGSRRERRLVLPASAAAVAALAVLLVEGEARAQQNDGLRWVGDARVGAATNGAFMLGPALRFRQGWRIATVSRHDADDDGEDDADVADILVGSFLGGELSAGLLVGAPEPNTFGALTLVALRPWLSQNQTYGFLRTELWSVLGTLLPEVGVTFGMRKVPRMHLGWDVPLGPHEFQFVPGVVWFSPGHHVPLLFTLAFRVPM